MGGFILAAELAEMEALMGGPNDVMDMEFY
jgi:hypothetical protein